MKMSLNRRKFFRTASALTVGATGLSALTQAEPAVETSVFVIGPQAGYSPQIGTLISMLNYNRHTITEMVRSMTMAELDYLHDPKANTVGSLILHLGATEKYYQINTFEGRQDFNDQEKKVWSAAMSLGDEGREKIKGHDAKYYLNIIAEVRQKTLEELKKKNDEWLLAIDPLWSKERPLNTYWKWFHVCEHESNHRGQIAWLQSRLPGAKAGTD
jgi:hypothetical protein